MNIFERKNIKLLNLVEKGISERTLLRIIASNTEQYITEVEIKKELGNTPTCKKVIDAFRQLDFSFYSIYCLFFFNINSLIIEKLKEQFKTLEILSKNLGSLASLNIRNSTEEKITEALNSLRLNSFVTLSEELFKEIEKNEPYSNNNLKVKFLNKYPSLNVKSFDQSIDSLISSGRLVQTIDGLKIKRQLLLDYLTSSTNEKDEIVLCKIKGQSLQQIANKKGLTRERIRQVINKQIKKYPIFHNENKYYKFLNLYNLSASELKLVGIDDKYLVEYVKIKYTLEPTKSTLDYIADFDLNGTAEGDMILKENGLVLIEGELVQADFIPIFKKFVNKNRIRSFCLNEIKEQYNYFLSSNKVRPSNIFIESQKDIKSKNRKLDNSSFFLSLGNQYYLVFSPDSLSSDFLETLDDYLSSFYGYGSLRLFFDNYTQVCQKNHINDEKELFALAKGLFSKKYEAKIDFVRNPIIATKGINKDTYITNLLLDMNFPCSVNSFLEYVNKTTGLNKESIYAHYSKTINQFKDSQDLLTLDNEVSDEQYAYVKSVLGNSGCVGYSYLFNLVAIKYGEDAHKILNANNLIKIGFTKTRTSIYSNRFENRLEAVISAIDRLDTYIVYESELSKISNMEYFHQRLYDFIDTNTFLKIGQNCFLNLRKRKQCNVLAELKKDFISILSSDEIYVLDNFIQSSDFTSILEKNTEYKDLLLSFNTIAVVKNIVLGLKDLNYLETSSTFIFSFRELSINLLIEDILNEYGSLSIFELEETLYCKFNIHKKATNSELSDMGFYCPKSSEKVYLTKKYYENELEEYLNGNS